MGLLFTIGMRYGMGLRLAIVSLKSHKSVNSLGVGSVTCSLATGLLYQLMYCNIVCWW